MNEKMLDGKQILWMESASPPAIWQKNVTLGASLSLIRGLKVIPMTHYDVLSLLFKFLNLILYLKNFEFSSFNHCNF